MKKIIIISEGVNQLNKGISTSLHTITLSSTLNDFYLKYHFYANCPSNQSTSHQVNLRSNGWEQPREETEIERSF